MNKLFLAGLLSVSLITPALAWDQTKMNEQVDQTNFLVDRDCSGTLIGNPQDGLILTAHHCIAQQYDIVEKKEIKKDGTVETKKIRVTRPGNVSQIYFKGPAEVQRNSYVYKTVADDDKLDLALLQVQTKLPNTEASQISCVDVERGDKVWAVGNAFVVLYSSVSTGTVASVTRSYRDLNIAGSLGDATDNGEHGLIQHTAMISPGNSGGALYNDKGKLVGVNVRGGGGWSFSVPLSDIQKFLTDTHHDKLIKCE